MSWNGTRISTPVSIADIQMALGLSSASIVTLVNDGGDGGDINMFARYKPVVYDPSVANKVTPLTSAERAHYYSKTNGSLPCTVRHGIMIPNGSDYNTLVENATTSAGTLKHGIWEYDYPTGGRYKVCRIEDFGGYYANAVPPIAFYCDAKGVLPIPSSGSGSIITFYLRGNLAASSVWSAADCLAWNELLTGYQEYYFTVHMICTANGSTFRYTKSGDSVSTMLQNNNIAMVHISTTDIKNIFSGYACIQDGAVWTALMLLSARSYAGTESDHEMMTGLVMRLEYKENVDRRTMTVKETVWTDSVTSLSFTVTMVKRSGYTNHYYVSSVVVNYVVTEQMTCAVDIQYMCPCGYVSGTSDETLTISDSINMSGTGSKTFSNNDIQSPDFVATRTFPNGEQIGAVTVTLTRDGSPVGNTANIRLDNISTSTTKIEQILSN